jgi:hypothetical protein
MRNMKRFTLTVTEVFLPLPRLFQQLTTSPIVWLPLALVLFPFGSGLVPVFPFFSGLGLPPSGSLPTPLSFLVFYGIVELVISFGLYRRADWRARFRPKMPSAV